MGRRKSRDEIEGVLTDLKFDPDNEHTYTYSDAGMVDKVHCSCGWRSNPYWDGADLAVDEWDRHILGEHIFVPGKNYVCECYYNCGETFKSMDIRRLEQKLERLKGESA